MTRLTFVTATAVLALMTAPALAESHASSADMTETDQTVTPADQAENTDSQGSEDGTETADSTAPTADDDTVTMTGDKSETADNADPMAEDGGETADNADPMAEDDSETAENADPMAEDDSETAENAEPVAEDDSETAESADPMAEGETSMADSDDPMVPTGNATADAAPEGMEDGTEAAANTQLLRVSGIEGGVVYTLDAQEQADWDTELMHDGIAEGWTRIGSIEDVVLSADGKLAGVVAEVGGFLGIGDKFVMLPVEEMKLVPTGEDSYAIVTPFTEDRLTSMQSIDEAMARGDTDG
ncbi:PRC-barrel domain-containing protein [Pseudoponticoccus marisrubri]|uniref:PRC-barrel domain-containing protein n=1 Tax=Pseudoponticoccus marisrubri TaxID=1685382 RepID=A0A0W7WP54_9RHOB|nr:PRC-barrel domain-containing protein [Pseudoponticoccus marisrubri]KUF12387.1 hypothetical protein AVJ23_01255 [Pseudoponticoccus marisrubri]